MGFPPHLNYLKEKEIIWFNPCWGFYAFWDRFNNFMKEKKLNGKEAWLHRDMKENKEKYVAALLALFLKKTNPEKNGWWFTKTLQDPPDAIIGTPEETVKGNLMKIREIEVVEYIGKGSVFEVIKTKLNKKQYEPNTVLVCMLSPENIEEIKFEEISKKIIKENFFLGLVFVLFHGCPLAHLNSLSKEKILSELSKISLIQLSPIYNFFSIFPQNICKDFVAGKEKAWLKFSGRGLSTGFDNVISENMLNPFN
jgi:hypothetical protein